MRNLSMKKFGTPIGAAPGVATDRPGLSSVGRPLGRRAAACPGARRARAHACAPPCPGRAVTRSLGAPRRSGAACCRSSAARRPSPTDCGSALGAGCGEVGAAASGSGAGCDSAGRRLGRLLGHRQGGRGRRRKRDLGLRQWHRRHRRRGQRRPSDAHLRGRGEHGGAEPCRGDGGGCEPQDELARVHQRCEFPYLTRKKRDGLYVLRSLWNVGSARTMRFFSQLHA